MPPERAALRQARLDAAQHCKQIHHLVVERVEIDSFDRVVAWYKDNKSPQDLDPFWECYRERAPR